MEMWLGADWNYINFGFNGMEFPVPVKVGRQMPKVLAETCDGRFCNQGEAEVAKPPGVSAGYKSRRI